MRKFIILLFLTFITQLFSSFKKFDYPTKFSTQFYKSFNFDFEYHFVKYDNNLINDHKSELFFFFPKVYYSDVGIGIFLENFDVTNMYGAKLTLSKRVNSKVQIANNLSYQQDLSNNYLAKIAPAITFKPFSNIEINASSEISYNSKFEYSHYLNSILHINKDMLLDFELSDNKDFLAEITTKHSAIQVSFGLKSSIDDFAEKQLTFQISYIFDKKYTTLATSISDFLKDQTIYFSYHQKYGNFNPPVTISNQFVPIQKKHLPSYGLVIQNEASINNKEDVIIKIKSGDNLYSLSKHLPKNVDPYFINNVSAITEYNNIDNPSKIYVGQKIKIPKINSSNSEVDRYTENEKNILDILTDKTYTSNFSEIQINRAFVLWKIENIQKIKQSIPMKGGANNAYILNSQAIVYILKKDYESAISKLKNAISISKDDQIIRTNLAFAYYLNSEIEKAKEIIEKSNGRTAFFIELKRLIDKK